MGLIKAVLNATGGNLADQWLEVIEAGEMSDTTVFTKGVKVRKNDKRSSNKRGTEDLITNGSIIHVYPNQFMMLVDGGKIVDYTAEEGYYKVDNTCTPSLFSGQFGESLKEAFSRVRYGGVPSGKQQVFYVNLQEIKGIKFGTPNPVNYFDNFYNSELFLRAHGTYSIKVTDPILFYTEVIAKNAVRMDVKDINEQYLSEFLEALQAAINQMSVDNIRISQVASKSRELSRYMATELDEDWKKTRGFEIQSVGIASISYDEESKRLINMRNQGAMMGDAAVREGYVQSAIARGLENAGSNPGGSGQAFMGMGMGMGAAGGFMASASATNAQQMQQQAAERQAASQAREAGGWTCKCGKVNSGRFCSECGSAKPAEAAGWTCKCGKVNSGKFCSECGSPRPSDEGWFCTECGHKNGTDTKFCPECGSKRG